ncbi:TPA: hypothetical protein U2J85_002662 [Acinetobacter baumannii]|nr:hypothetical protein [Acinetobacter baumannii]
MNDLTNASVEQVCSESMPSKSLSAKDDLSSSNVAGSVIGHLMKDVWCPLGYSKELFQGYVNVPLACYIHSIQVPYLHYPNYTLDQHHNELHTNKARALSLESEKALHNFLY